MGSSPSSVSQTAALRSLALSFFLATICPAVLCGQVTFTVNSANDTDDGACDASHCSLREALNAAALEAGGAVIAFDIPGPAPHTIRPASVLPFLMGQTVLDGTTEPDFAGTPVIELDGSSAGAFAQGLDVAGSGNVIRALVVNRFSGNGIAIASGAEGNLVESCYVGTDVTGTASRGNGNAGILIGQASNNTVGGTTAVSRNVISGNAEGVTIVDASATGNVVMGNHIGTDVSGTVSIPNGTGVLLLAPGNTVGGTTPGSGNVISGNLERGVGLDPPNATGNAIVGNYIGVDVSGAVALGNDIGVWVNDVAGNTVGGIAPGAGNVISGNREGITFWEAGATGNTVQGNHIGTNGAGDAAVPNDVGMAVYSPGNTIGGAQVGAGNVISGNLSNGVSLYGPDAWGNLIQGNLIGTEATGASALANGGPGVQIHAAATGNTIGGTEPGARNVLSGNTFGILIGDLESSGTLIQGNYIGTNATGDAPIPNAETGILLWSHGTIIGGSEPGAGNVISGNLFAGIDLGGGSSGTVIQGNLIGTDVTGSMALGNDLGIFVNFSFDNVIGGATAGAGNVISGNVGSGMTVNGVDASGNVIQGNRIGTDATGSAKLPNDIGILVLDAPNNTVGGTAAGAGNLISGNTRNGIRMRGISAVGNSFLGNYVGTDATGASDLGNGTAGIVVGGDASASVIGSDEPGGGNVVAYNGRGGIVLTVNAGLGNRIRLNSVFDNERLGIDLANDLVTANDESDADTGPNGLQNHPSLSAVGSGGGVSVRTSLGSAPSGAYELDFFASVACDESGFGEGRTPLGTASLTTDAAGVGSVVASFTGVTGTVLTATTTDAQGNTSEFSECAPLTALEVSASPPAVTVSPGQVATYAILVTADASFGETVALTCSGAPTGTTCQLGEAELGMVAGQASTTMTVTTVAPARSGPWTLREGPSSFRPLWVSAALALALLVAGAWRPSLFHTLRRPRRRPALGRAVLTAVGSAALVTIASCGDDGTSPPSGGTPAGTYPLTVTATWESVQATASTTLVVQ